MKDFEKIDILICEDSTFDAKLLLKYINQADFKVEHEIVASRNSMKEQLEKKKWDIILSDFSMPEFNALDVIQLLNEMNIDIPVIVISGILSEETAIELMKAGASDFIVKGNYSRLIPAIKRELKESDNRKLHRKALVELKNSEAKFKRIAENASDLIYQITIYPSFKLDFINHACFNITGYLPEELYKNPELIKTVIHPEDLRYWEQFLSGKIDYSKSFMIRCINKEGNTIYTEHKLNPVFNDSGRIASFEGIARNVSDFIKVQNELVAARNKAEEMNRLKSNFLANMSHELRTPLIGILGYSEFLSEEREESNIPNIARTIHKSGLRLLSTLNLILNQSKIESEMIELNLQNIQVSEVIDEAVKLFVPVASKKKLILKKGLFVKGLIAYLDEKLLRDIINNLLNNAIKFTNNGGVTVDLFLEKNKIVLKVIDTGIGISKEYQSLVFEEFRQVSEGRNRNFEGTGLGLTITKKFVELLGGEIKVESESNSGSTFIVTIPSYRYSKVDIDKLASKKEKVVSKVPEIKTKPKILLVDDEQLNIAIISNYLSQIFDVDYAIDMKDTLDKLKTNRYELVLMDVNLGIDITGFDVAREIKKLPAYKTVPIIAMTAYDLSTEKASLESNGCAGYILKPFEKEELINLVTGFIQN
jgi:PAS domain S-box-containing protein